MAFNHYAKLQRIVATLSPGWYIRRIDAPTRAKNFRGDIVEYDHYYRLYAADGEIVKYGKFQHIDRLASVLGLSVGDLPVLEGL